MSTVDYFGQCYEWGKIAEVENKWLRRHKICEDESAEMLGDG